MRFKTWYDYFIVFTIFVKIVYIILTSFGIYYSLTNYVINIKNKRASNSGGTSNNGGGSNDGGGSDGNRETLNKRVDFLKKINYWRDRVEFIFIANMAIILMYLFYPGKEKQRVIDSEARLLLFSYGSLIILTAKWGIFFNESKWFEYFQDIIGKNFSNYLDGDITNAHNIINNNIETIANMTQFYDSKKQQEKSQHNNSYQRYYTNIYTPETIGQYVYKPVAVPVNVNMGQIKSAI